MLAVVVAVSWLGWLIRIVVGVLAIVVIYVIGAGILAKFKVAPRPSPTPTAVVAVDVRFRCGVCGAEVTMTAAQSGEAVEAPRHCREDMVRVGPIG